jgi:hypothetical protein
MMDKTGLKKFLDKLLKRTDPLTGKVSISGIFTIKHIRNGKVIDTRIVKNTITTDGLAAVAGLVNGVVTNFFEYIAIGTGTTGAQESDSALETEITDGGGARASASTSRVTTTDTNDTAQLQHTFSFTLSKAVTESGVLDSASSGVLLCRQTFSAVNVVDGDSLQITWKIQIDQAA